ncbi:MAG: PIG-L family deacetylase [Proteobacteria bacterium]|nr:PIG-L family deacetylase [Pseudomonadota bacterium]
MTQNILTRIICAAVCGMSLIFSSAYAQVRSEYDNGVMGLYRVLQQLQTTASAMQTGAHPDDEDSALLAYLARRESARTAYLSLTRGDGGQNLVGPELFEQLGVIRTEELLQARRLDGAEQLFTRAVDFGFSEQRAEAARLWDEEIILGDMVRAIRLFRPMVVVSRFTGTPADGHGHHQFAGYLTPLAIEAAADPSRFTDQIAEGLMPWQTQKTYVTERMDSSSNDTAVMALNTGEVSPVIGRSYFEIAMQGRSQQKTQQMGSLEYRGPQTSGVRLIESRVQAPHSETSVFDGIDTTVTGISRYETIVGSALVEQLTKLENVAADALETYDPRAPEKLIPVLARGLDITRTATSTAQQSDTRRLLRQKSTEFETALRLASGIVVDALGDSETVVAGSVLNATVHVFLDDDVDVTVSSVNLVVPDNWTATLVNDDSGSDGCEACRNERPTAEWRFLVKVPDDADITQPYWLEHPSRNFGYDWSMAGDARNQPFRPPLLTAEVSVTVAGADLKIRKAVEFRFADGARGELRRPIDVVPAVSVSPATELLIVPTSRQDQTYELLQSISNNTDNVLEGTATFDVPGGWIQAPAALPFLLRGRSASTTLGFTIGVPGGTSPGKYEIMATASVDGRQYQQAMQQIAHPHIQSHRVYRPSALTVQLIDVKVAPVKVGYVMGSGDAVPEAIRRLGVDVVLLDDNDLAVGDLTRFDIIIVGIRASGTRPAFVANNGRLLEFAEQGGTLVVQYQQGDYFSAGLPPFPASMQPSVRTIDEAAPVTILQPDHPLFNFPNKIVAADFDNWVQERNGYTFTEFDKDHYVPLLECHDEGESESNGGMMYARIGAGQYLYTSYAWFRQLPQGVPGAYRIFANILSLPRSR